MTDAEDDRQRAADTADRAVEPAAADAKAAPAAAGQASAETVSSQPASPQSASSQSAPPEQPAPIETVSAETVRVRRTPRYARFILVGVVVCVIVAFILTYSFPQGAGYDRNTVFGFMLLVAIAVGVTLGSLAALIADRIARRRAQTVVADRIDVRVQRDSTPSDRHDA